MKPYAVALLLAALLALLAAPVVAQADVTAPPEASAAAPQSATSAPATPPTPEPPPTPVPYGDEPLVQAVLFFSPTCGHCHYVITETLPPLFEAHGGTPVVTWDQSIPVEDVASYLMSNGRLQILLVDVGSAIGQAMFSRDSERLGMGQAGVPRVDIEGSYLVGSDDIPDQFPGMVAQGFAGAGIGWPPVPGLPAALAPFVEEGSVPDPTATAATDLGTDPAVTPSAAPADASAAPAHDPFAVIPVTLDPDESPLDKLARDPLGNGIAIVVLLLLVSSLIAAPLLAMHGSLPTFPAWLVVVLAVVGLAVAAYLATIETSGSEAVCGPVGDCNAVQESEYAKILGVPIGVLGVVGYLLIGGLWLVSRVARRPVADWALVLLALGALGGTAFSAYLTFLEPFVIGATCMWCITSAVVMMALLWVTAGPGWAAWVRLRGG